MGFKKEVLEKLDKIESKLVEQSVNLALNNSVLTEHHKRSTQLEARVAPLESSHVFVNKLSKAIAAIIAMTAGIAASYHYFLSK